MKKWQAIRWILGGLSAGSAATAAAIPKEMVKATLAFVGLTALLAGLVINLPKDPWTPEERAKKSKKSKKT